MSHITLMDLHRLITKHSDECICSCEGDATEMLRKMRVAIFFLRFGPYHIARLEALDQRLCAFGVGEIHRLLSCGCQLRDRQPTPIAFHR